jgi:hypothetical protein
MRREQKMKCEDRMIWIDDYELMYADLNFPLDVGRACILKGEKEGRIIQSMLNERRMPEVAERMERLSSQSSAQDGGVRVREAMSFLGGGFIRRNGVVLHVGKELAKELLNCHLDMSTADITVPYPTVEIAVPFGIPINDDYDLTSIGVMDTSYWIKKNGINEKNTHIDKREFDLCLIIGKIRKSGDPAQSQDLMNFVIPIEKSHSVGEAIDRIKNSSDNLTTVMAAQVKFALATFAYIQAVAEESAKGPVKACKSQKLRITSPLKSLIEKNNKNQRHLKLVNVIERKPGCHSKGNKSGRHLKEGHWRGVVLRSLRHPKYKRMPNGKPRIIKINPCWVGPPSADKFTSQRKIQSTEIIPSPQAVLEKHHVKKGG